MESMEEQKRSSGLILVAIDESTGSNNAFQWALNNQWKDFNVLASEISRMSVLC
jgi:hypothetical protein